MSYEKGKSLLEFKKQQWAREREELAKMGEMFSHSSERFERTSIRTYYSNLDISQRNNVQNRHYIDQRNHRRSYELMNDEDYAKNTQFYDIPNIPKQRLRSPSLPAIRQKNYAVRKNLNKIHQDEDTSGYTSDSGNNSHSPEIWYAENNQIKHGLPKDFKNHYNYDRADRGLQFHQNQPKGEFRDEKINFSKLQEKRMRASVTDLDATSGHEMNNYQNNYFMPPSSPSNVSRDISTSSTYPVNAEAIDYGSKSKDERAKWNNWKSNSDYSSNSSDYKTHGPGWLSRGLHDLKDSEDDTHSVHSVSHLRGQNIPLDPIVLAERVNKRRKAIEFQNAIKQQLEERERLRQWELERRMEEERLEEERLLRQRQIEQDRLEYEQQLQLEKEEAQKRKEEAILLAIAKAEEAAKMEKQKKKRNKAPAIEDSFTKATRKEIPPTESEIINLVPTRDSENTLNSNPSNSARINEDENESVEEKVLIGTPINLKKTFKSSSQSNEAADVIKPEKELESIALVLQPTTLIPLPVTTDIFGLQNSIGNLQVAAYIMQQQQQIMSGIDTSQSIISNPNPDDDKIEPKSAITAEEPKSLVKVVPTNLTYTDDPSNGSSEDVEPMCRLCGKCHYSNFAKRPSLTLYDDVSSTRITEIVESSSISNNISGKECEAPEKDKQIALRDTNQSSNDRNDSQDASTQTEAVTSCELCLFHNNFYKVCLKREVSTTTTTQTSKQKPSRNESVSEDKDGEMTTTTTTTTTTTYRAKPKNRKRTEKLEERPKWGVNRPIVQYVKASERDPFYLKNKKRKNPKATRSLSVDSRSVSEEEAVTKARNVCTEILPIKTDEKGRIYLNFREASTIMNEDEIKEKLRERYFNFGKVLDKRHWENPSNGNEIVRRASNPDIGIDTA